MKFMVTRITGYRPVREAEYTVRPRAIQVDPVTHMRVGEQRRLFARFEGNPPVFDSEEAQRKYGWTDEERIMVERHLLQHEDWGRGLFLFPGETVPEHLADIAPEEATPSDAPTVTVHDGMCQFIVREFPVELCGDEALSGSEYCEKHFREVAEVVA